MKTNHYLSILIKLIFILFLLGIIYLVWIKYQPVFVQRPSPDIDFPPIADSNCGFARCHGLDLSCTDDAPEVCDTMYQLGDSCREYATCEKVNGTCQLDLSPDFDSCKACVIACEGEDPELAFDCENTCREELERASEQTLVF